MSVLYMLVKYNKRYLLRFLLLIETKMAQMKHSTNSSDL